MIKARTVVAALVAITLLASACGSDEEAEEAPAVDAPAAATDSETEDVPAETDTTEAMADSSDPIRIPLHN